jgi:transcriptional regulator with XRE-family HTH domain
VAIHSNKEYFKKVGLRIKMLRMERGLTARALTHDVGRVENAGDDIRLSSILKLCEYFEISIQEFFEGL